MKPRTVLAALLLCALMAVPVSAAPPTQGGGQEYVVQKDDWLSKIAEKYYGDMLAYPVIVDATNAKAEEDSSFATITNPGLIEIGQMLWIPDVPSEEEEVTAFVHVHVLPMDQERVLSDQTVIVRGGRLVEIGPVSSTSVPAGATQIDAAGQYLMPALSDMHIHLEGQAWNIMFPPEAQFSADDLDFSKILFPYVANGVATVQIMSALPEHVTLRGQISRGEVLGPRLVLARMIDGPERAWPPPIADWVATPAEARQAVLDANEAGYDRIKLYSFLSQESYDAILATAQELGMGTDGEIPDYMSVEHVVAEGLSSIVHMEEITEDAQGTYDQEQIDYFTKIMAESDTWATTTLILSRNILAVLDDLEGELGRPEVRYLHPMAQGMWSVLAPGYLSWPPEKRVQYAKDYEFMQQLTKALSDGGAKLMTGTDALVPTTVPGFSIHRELEELVGVGLTPYQALRASTTNPFEFLGELDEAGTVEVGKRADLVLLEANPLEAITNTREIAGVMIQGRWLSQAELQEGLDELAASYETFGQ